MPAPHISLYLGSFIAGGVSLPPCSISSQSKVFDIIAFSRTQHQAGYVVRLGHLSKYAQRSALKNLGDVAIKLIKAYYYDESDNNPCYFIQFKLINMKFHHHVRTTIPS